MIKIENLPAIRLVFHKNGLEYRMKFSAIITAFLFIVLLQLATAGIYFFYTFHEVTSIIPGVLSLSPSFDFGMWHYALTRIFHDFSTTNILLLLSGGILIFIALRMIFKFSRWIPLPLIVLLALLLFLTRDYFDHTYASKVFAVKFFAFALTVLFTALAFWNGKTKGRFIIYLALFAAASNFLIAFIPMIDKFAVYLITPFSRLIGNINFNDFLILLGLVAAVYLHFPAKKSQASAALPVLLCMSFSLTSCHLSKEENADVISNYDEETDVQKIRPNPHKEAWFGDLHLHTNYSFDSYSTGNKIFSPEAAYRFAKGEAVTLPNGTVFQRKRPLDFLAVTDHSEYIGAFTGMSDEQMASFTSEPTFFERLLDLESSSVFAKIGKSISQGTAEKEFYVRRKMNNAWEDIKATAIRHHIPGEFTTFIGYEWTSTAPITMHLNVSSNYHRNVIFSNGYLPATPFTSIDSKYPEDLWVWLEMQRGKGAEVIAIPHNANKSNGLMYNGRSLRGIPINETAALTRMKNEPIHEVIQIKAQSMASMILSPNDEFAGFEEWTEPFNSREEDALIFREQYGSKEKGSYVREALKDGLLIEKSEGANPYKFGFIGSTDQHTGLSFTDESSYIVGEHLEDDSPASRIKDRLERKFNPGGLAGIWATANTREALFNSMLNKEVFATSGTRIKTRFFAAAEIPADFLNELDWASLYATAVPMGGSFPGGEISPEFLVWAVKDPDGANLDRIQVIKGWVDDDNVTHESIYNAVWSDTAARAMDAFGDLPPVTNTVNASEASYTNEYGAVQLAAVWKDPDFKPGQKAFYYLRVLEIPTPRWSTYDLNKVGRTDGELPVSIQERAWSSPIWID